MKLSITKKVDRLFSEWDKKNSPGCALAVVRDGKIIYKRGYGAANLEHGIPISPATVFDIGSTSKQFVAASVALLARDGKLSLDDNIRKYLPEMPEYKYAVTIRHLLHHTSGIRDYLTLMALAGLRYENEYPDEEIIGLIAQQKDLNFPPGEEFLYCNSGYLLLAEIVKRVSGSSMRAFAEKRIFSPLGMKATHFNDDFSTIVKNRATGYAADNGGFKISMSIFDVVGDGAVHTTVEDLFRWDQNFYNNSLGGYGQGFIEEITAPGSLNNGEKLGYAFGLFTAPYRGLRMVCHGGAWMGYRAEMLRLPQHKFSVICLSNLSAMNPTTLAKDVADIYLAGLFPEQKDRSTPEGALSSSFHKADLKGKSGLYFSAQTAGIIEFTEKENRLILEISGTMYKLAPGNRSRFTCSGNRLYAEFKSPPLSACNEVLICPERGRPAVYRQLPPVHVNSKMLREYAGEYYCAELETSYRIAEEGGKLALGRKNCPKEILTLAARDLLKGAWMSLAFTRGRKKEVSGFALGAGRVKNIIFLKSGGQ